VGIATFVFCRKFHTFSSSAIFFWKSVKIWHSYRQSKSGNFLRHSVVGARKGDRSWYDKTSFTRYNLSSNRLWNRFDNRLDNRLYRVYKHPTGCQYGLLYNRFDNRLYGVQRLCVVLSTNLALYKFLFVFVLYLCKPSPMSSPAMSAPANLSLSMTNRAVSMLPWSIAQIFLDSLVQITERSILCRKQLW